MICFAHMQISAIGLMMPLAKYHSFSFTFYFEVLSRAFRWCYCFWGISFIMIRWDDSISPKRVLIWDSNSPAAVSRLRCRQRPLIFIGFLANWITERQAMIVFISLITFSTRDYRGSSMMRTPHSPAFHGLIDIKRDAAVSRALFCLTPRTLAAASQAMASPLDAAFAWVMLSISHDVWFPNCACWHYRLHFAGSADVFEPAPTFGLLMFGATLIKRNCRQPRDGIIFTTLSLFRFHCIVLVIVLSWWRWHCR